MDPVIKTTALSHVYSVDTPFERVAIENIDFEAYEGEFIGVIGHTGSGKSTFIQHLNGLLKPSAGAVFFRGENIWQIKTSEFRFKVGLVFQYPEYQLFEETVRRDIAFGPKNMKLSESEIEERVISSIRFVGLSEDILDKSPFDLSGGQKRRAAIAGVMAMRPEVLILDEPTAGLDPAGRRSILQNIRDYQKDTNSTILMVTHSMEEVAASVGRIVVFNQGAIVMDGTPEQIFSRAPELTDIGLEVPQVTHIFMRLREMGLDDLPTVFTVKQAKEALLAYKGVGGHA